MHSEPVDLSAWRVRALDFERQLNAVLVGMPRTVRLMTIAVFARGHVLLEGDVGVGKTTLLKAVARGIGGAYQRIEGTVDLMPGDLVYHTYVGDDGRPRVEPGPLIAQGSELAVFFFNEINRARPQVHALLLRLMAERTVSAFNREYTLPWMQVFADRNRVEREETFELPSAARDRFLMEVSVEAPDAREQLRGLMFDTRFHDADALIASVEPGMLDHTRLNAVAEAIQGTVQSSPVLDDYGVDLWLATRRPTDYGVGLSGVDMDQFILSGASPRGVAMLTRAARVQAWLEGRDRLIPEDMHTVFFEAIAHRLCLSPVYETQRALYARPFVTEVLRQVASP
jgi:MoxR-like ATPase